MTPRIGFILSGCGVYDGTEIHEAVLSMLALQKRGFQLVYTAPNIDMAHVINHGDGTPMEGETRNVLIESSRIVRGPVRDLATISIDEVDGLFFPGGFGAAKNLSDFAFKGPQYQVQKDVARIVQECFNANKPMAFACIAPIIAAKVVAHGVELTVGSECPASEAIRMVGARHVALPVEKAHTDHTMKVVTTPAYMLAADVVEAEASINAAVEAFAALF